MKQLVGALRRAEVLGKETAADKAHRRIVRDLHDGIQQRLIALTFRGTRAGVFDAVLKHLAVPSYVEDGILFGPCYEGDKGTAMYNSSFRPFQSPVPFLFVRHGVTSDWKFFLDDEEWLNL
jgi:hypothetical protein